MKVCPNCQTPYPDDANFCPQESCATAEGPRRLDPLPASAAAPAPAGPRYQLDEQIGGGRSGEVWRATDSQTGAPVAFKRIVRTALPTVAALERAQRELKQLQRAQSPRVAQVLDFGKAPEGGTLFVVTELVDGRPLDAVVAESGPMPLDRVKKLIAQIGEALLEGQKVGVVHHDLAAKNVLVGAGDDVKVINFVAPCPVTETVFGVPEYLSPEQTEGKLVDQRSNTYSLGAILSLLLTGQPPVSGPDARAIIDQIQRGELVPPSRRVPGLTPEIDRVVAKAMEKSPNRRPLTLRQFLTEVGGLVAPGAAAEPSRPGAGFAKTMMFTGASPEIQRLVDQAVAARAGGNGAPVGAATPPPAGAEAASAQETPPPQPGQTTGQTAGQRRTHGAAVAATVVSMPAAAPRAATPAGGAPGADAGTETPPPLTAAPAPTGAPGPTPKPGPGGAFRETLWFKKGDVDQMVADARARVQATRDSQTGDPVQASVPEAEAEAEAAAVAAAEVPAEDARPIEERYVDDGSVTVEDRKKFSLRSGGTAAGLPTVGGMVPGQRMSDTEVVAEIGGRKRLVVIVVAVAVVIALVAVVAVGFRKKDVSKGAAALAPVPVETQQAPPPETAPAAPPAPAPAAAAGAEKDQKDAAEDDTPGAATKPAQASARKAAKKKAPAKTSAKPSPSKKHK